MRTAARLRIRASIQAGDGNQRITHRSLRPRWETRKVSSSRTAVGSDQSVWQLLFRTTFQKVADDTQRCLTQGVVQAGGKAVLAEPVTTIATTRTSDEMSSSMTKKSGGNLPKQGDGVPSVGWALR